MKKKRAILASGIWSTQQKRGPICSAETAAEAYAKAKKDLEKLEKHYNTIGAVISESDTLLWKGEVDSIFEE